MKQLGPRTTLIIFVLGFFFLSVSCPGAPVLDDPVTLDDSLSARAEARGKLFGAAVSYQALFNADQPEAAERYRSVLASQFNLLVAESEMKMKAIWTGPGTLDFAKADAIADWAQAEGKKMRFHALLWYRSLPAWLVAGYQDGTYTQQEVADLVEWYIGEVVAHFEAEYPGLFIAWDVVNETIGPNDPRTVGTFGLRPAGADYLDKNEDFWRLTLGDDYVALAFQWARAASAGAQLFYNDYHAEYDNPKGDAILAFVQGLIADGVPIDGVGLQCHFSLAYLSMSHPGIDFSVAAISAAVDAWIATGLDVHITEADIGMAAGQEAAQADLYTSLLAASLLKSGVSAFVSWGFTDLVSWRYDERPLYFDRSINPKPAYYSMLEALIPGP